MRTDDIAVACRLLGAAGGSSGVRALAGAEYADTSTALNARTRYQYRVFSTVERSL
jgi:hypothetical protein